MTSGKRPLLLPLLLTALPCAAAPAPDRAQRILASLAQPPPAHTAFVELRYMGMLDRPLVLAGEMQWLGGDRLERDVRAPYRETAKIGNGEMSVQRGDGPVRRIGADRAPQIGAMLAGFRALLGGDFAALAPHFDVRAAGDTHDWALTLLPRENVLKSTVQSIEIDGGDRQPRCMITHEADGDVSITLLGPLAERGAPSPVPLADALQARCRNGS